MTTAQMMGKTILCNYYKIYIKKVYFCPYIALLGAEMGVLLVSSVELV